MERVFGYGGTTSFCGRLLDGEGMSDVCREFGISRKTGYKVFDRYKEHGLEALSDRWKVVPLLQQGVPYREIHELTGVSVTTTGRVARSLDHGHGRYAAAIAATPTSPESE